jgi:autotransporter-associated beta strand protein
MITQTSNGTFAGLLSGSGSLTKLGSSTLSLSANQSSYIGTVTVSSGILALTGNGSFSSASSTDVEATLDISGAIGTTLLTNLTGTSTNGLINMAGSSLNVNEASSGIFAGLFSGSGNLTKSGTGTLSLSSNQSSYTGAVTLSVGTLLLTGSGSLSSAASVDVETTLDITGVLGSTSIGSLVGTSTNGLINMAGKGLTITQTVSGTFAGLFSGTGSLTKSGTNMLILSSNQSSYTGALTVSEGTLAITGASSLNSVSSLDVEGTLDITGATGSAIFANLLGTSTNGLVNMGGKGITLNQAVSSTFAGLFSGTGNLTKSGTASLSLSSSQSSYAGALTVSGGTLALTGSGSVNNATSVDVEATFDITGVTSSTSIANLTGTSSNGLINMAGKGLTVNQTSIGLFAGLLSGSGNFIKSGSISLPYHPISLFIQEP